MIKRHFIFSLACLFGSAAWAQAWPSKPIRLIVPYAAGGPTDVLGRQLAQRLGPLLGQTIMVDNKTGAGGVIGVTEVLRSAADGYTLGLVAPGPVAISPVLTKVPYAQDEIGYVTLVARGPAVIAVNSKSGIATLDELVRRGKGAAGLTYSSAGNGTTPHMAAEMFVQETGVRAVHVPYRGSAPAVTALLGEEVQFTVTDLMGVLAHVQSGAVKVLAILGPMRTALASGVPTTSELGMPQVVMETSYGIIGPRGIVDDRQKRLRDAVAEVLKTPEMKTFLEGLGVVGVTSHQQMASEQERLRLVVRRGNIKID